MEHSSECRICECVEVTWEKPKSHNHVGMWNVQNVEATEEKAKESGSGSCEDTSDA